MSKINLVHDKMEYVLEYNRQSVKTMEAQDFALDEIASKPMTMIPMLFSGAFIKNHRGVKRAVIDEIFDTVPDKSALIEALMEMYAETLSVLTESVKDEGNVTWARAK